MSNSIIWWKSRTLWLNIIAFLIGVLALPDFISILPANILPYHTLAISLLNFALRFDTTKPISGSN